MSGLFVAFEGGEGAGKSTLAAAVADRLARIGVETVLTREPGGTPVGSRLREIVLHSPGLDPRAQLMIFAADRAQHVTDIIRPALDRGAVVLCDRYLASSIAYQGAGGGLDTEVIRAASDIASGGLRPDLTILLDVDPQTRAQRRGTGSDVMERRDGGFHDRVRAAFLALAAEDPANYLVACARTPLADTTDVALVEICSRLSQTALDRLATLLRFDLRS